MRDVLDKYGVDKSLLYKPDVFTRRGIYSSHAEYKSYIYAHRWRVSTRGIRSLPKHNVLLQYV